MNSRSSRRYRLMAATCALIVASAGTMLGASPAAAVSKVGVKGTVNCNGSRTWYSATRYLTGYRDTDLYLRQAAYSDGNILSGKRTAMTLSLRINKTGQEMHQWVSGADRWAKFSTGGFLPKTAFILGASMEKSAGSCHNGWAGTLHY